MTPHLRLAIPILSLGVLAPGAVHAELLFPERASPLGPDEFLQDLHAADVDGDGDVDMVLGIHGMDLLPDAPDVLVFENVGGAPEDWPTEVVIADYEGLSSVLAFDGDGDGDLDIAAAGPDVRGVARGAAWSPVGVAQRPTGVLVAADFDADGDLDLVSGGPAGVTLLADERDWYQWLRIELDPRPVDDLHVVDVDGDGDPDLVRVADYEADWLRNDGTAWTAMELPTLDGILVDARGRGTSSSTSGTAPAESTRSSRSPPAAATGPTGRSGPWPRGTPTPTGTTICCSARTTCGGSRTATTAAGGRPT